jgi:hypothetical protein
MTKTTTALLGFYYKNKYYVAYQESNGEPCQLGKNVVSEIKEVILNDQLEEWKKQFHELTVVNDLVQPILQDIENLKPFTDLEVSRCSENDWYCLTYKCKGSLQKILDSKYLYNYVNENWFPYFQDYAYILNFDCDMLDFYEDSLVKKSYYLSEYQLPNW